MEIGLVWYALAVYLATQSPPGATSGLKAVSGEHVLAKKLHLLGYIGTTPPIAPTAAPHAG
jgi:hypothetical protein